MIGRTISHYKILEKIGAGGMGEVYLAEDLDLERRVAIKFLPQHLTRDKDSIERFKREAKAAASLNHPNIVTIHEIIESDNQLCIVMEHVSGNTLREIINTNPNSPFPIPNSIDIIQQTATGLSVAHNAGIVHRDIKPENILIDKEGRVKILDFGLAKLKGSGNLTKETSTLGTVYYMSPEQTRGETVDQRSDIWSLGVVIYEILTGQKPFRGDYDQAVVYSILNEDIPDSVDLPESSASIVKKCLKKNPQERYQNLNELLSDLKMDTEKNKPAAIDKRKGTRSSWLIPTTAFIIITLLIAGYFVFRSVVPGSEMEEQWQHSIAVLPFDDLSPHKDQDYFCIGMTEQILSNLSRLKHLKVIARTSVMKYQNTQKSIAEIGEELDVQNILSGSVQRTADKVRITVQLLNASNGAYLWSQKYDSDISDLFSLQDEVSKNVADALNITLKSGSSVSMMDTTSSPEAYEYCLKGEYISRYGIVDKALSEHDRLFQLSEDHFKRSLQLDPSFVRAKLGLAELYLSYLFLHGDERHMAKVLQYSDETLAADPDNDFALTLKGGYYYEMIDPYQATKYFKTALQINPNAAKALYYLGLFYESKGLYYQAKDCFVKAVQIDPLNTFYLYSCGSVFLDLALYDQAEKYYQKLFEFNPDHVLGRWSLTWLNLYRGHYAVADSVFEQQMKMFPDFDLNFYAQSRLAAIKGDKEMALSLEKDSPYNYLLLNMKKEAIDHLQTELNRKVIHYNYLILMNHPWFEPVRNDPRFIQIVQQQKEIYEQNLRKYTEH